MKLLCLPINSGSISESRETSSPAAKLLNKSSTNSFREEWAIGITARYKGKVSSTKSGVGYSVFSGPKKIYKNAYDTSITAWNEKHKQKFTALKKLTLPFDDGCSECLRVEKSGSYNEHEEDILERDQQPKQPLHTPASPATALSPTAKPFAPATSPKQEGDVTQKKQSKTSARDPIVSTPLSSTYGGNTAASASSTPQAAKKPLVAMEKYIESTRGYLSFFYKDIGLDPKMLEPCAPPFEVAVSGNAKQQLRFRQEAIMKIAHRCINKDLRIACIDRDDKSSCCPT
ncbi:uncharacterized protein LY79DRAFT_355958 [Colletotrichum navitas]|uniref:Uncharacterized protein n=1 Tax=Colletotrichum navitas TaxID=681940 RepID=A0AAD8VAD2_9PEZI|nr:uncharacterized protein LY79DRAFT_355958 [Colletotrichum navitas]KAK1597771.1 hypothetical protein LY79DRAFT_355958 [Colletotrichum navitas]